MPSAVADTHAAVWYLAGDTRLSSTARKFIESAFQRGDTIYVSAITLVEMVYLVEKGRITQQNYDNLDAALNDPTSVFVEAIVSKEIALAMRQVSAKQIPDMPDRVIAATAVHYGLPVISRDHKIRVSTIATIW